MKDFRGLLIRRMKQLAPEQSGAISTFAAIGIVAFLGCAALAIDVAHLVSMKGELQKAADAGALAGARALALGTPFPNWTNGETVATATTKKNKFDGQLITDCQVQSGYWSLTWNEGNAPANLQPQGITPTNLDLPAVKVTVNKTGGQNGGPLTLLFARILGISDPTPMAISVAAMKSTFLPVSAIPPGDGFPLATPQTFVQQNWDRTPPVSFRIGSTYHSPDGGQWTSFLVNANDVPTIRELIDNGNPTPLKIGDQIWIEPGTKTTLYDDAACRIGETVLLPVVPDNFDTHALAPILGFVPFCIEAVAGGSDKYIQGHFVPNYTAPGASGSGGAPNYGAVAQYDSPKVVD